MIFFKNKEKLYIVTRQIFEKSRPKRIGVFINPPCMPLPMVQAGQKISVA